MSSGYKEYPLMFEYVLEQPPYLVKGEVRKLYKCEYTDRGALRIRLPPANHPGIYADRFIEDVKRLRAEWQWTNMGYDSGTRNWYPCSSHIRVAVRKEVFTSGRDYLIALTLLYNLSITASIIMMPILAWHNPDIGVHMFRRGVMVLAPYSKTRYLTPDEVEEILEGKHQVEHEGAVVIRKEVEGKPPVVEIRVPDSHIASLRYFAVLLGEIFTEIVNLRGLDHQLLLFPIYCSKKDLLICANQLLKGIDYAISDYLLEGTTIWLLMRNIGNVCIVKEIPRILRCYGSLFEAFRDLLLLYTPPEYPSVRLAYFYYKEMHIRDNLYEFWNVTAPYGEFMWKVPKVIDGEMIEYLQKERKLLVARYRWLK